MQTRTLGNQQVGAIGLGLMTFDQTGTQPRQQLLDTVTAALDAGVTLFDTADAYGPGDEKGADAQGENERLIASILDELGVRDRVRAGHQGRPRPHRGRRLGHRQLAPATSARPSTPACERLGVEQIALWQHHRPDPKVPYDEVIGTLKEIADSGKVADVGLSNADPDQIRAAHAVLGDALVSVQNQFSPKFRSAAARDRRLRGARPGVPAVEPARRPLATPRSSPTSTRPSPRSPQDRGVSAQQVALAWELAQSPVRHPDPGRQATLVDHRLRGGGRHRAHRRRAGPPRRELSRGPSAPDPRGRHRDGPLARARLHHDRARRAPGAARLARGPAARRARGPARAGHRRELRARASPRWRAWPTSARVVHLLVRDEAKGAGVARPDPGRAPRRASCGCGAATSATSTTYAASPPTSPPRSPSCTRSCTTPGVMPPERTESRAGPRAQHGRARRRARW